MPRLGDLPRVLGWGIEAFKVMLVDKKLRAFIFDGCDGHIALINIVRSVVAVVEALHPLDLGPTCATVLCGRRLRSGSLHAASQREQTL